MNMDGRKFRGPVRVLLGIRYIRYARHPSHGEILNRSSWFACSSYIRIADTRFDVSTVPAMPDHARPCHALVAVIFIFHPRRRFAIPQVFVRPRVGGVL